MEHTAEMCDRLMAPRDSCQCVEERPRSCDNCSKNRQDIGGGAAAAAAAVEMERRIHLKNKSSCSGSSIRRGLLRLGRQASKLITNPNLIIVLIVVLSNCPSAVRAKPVARSGSSSGSSSSSSTSQSGGGGVPSLPAIVSINPEEWFTVENGKVNLKRELAPAALKMDRMTLIGKETVNMMKLAINQMQHQLEQYIRGYWFEQDEEALENTWSHQINDVEWLGRTKNVEEVDRSEYLNELIDLYVRFQKIAVGIRMIQQHNEQEEKNPRQNIATQMGNSAERNVGKVLRSLDEYYQTLNSHGWDLNDIPPVDDSVNPNWDYQQDNRIIHHYVILKEFLNHLRFSNEVVERFNEDEAQKAAASSSSSSPSLVMEH